MASSEKTGNAQSSGPDNFSFAPPASSENADSLQGEEKEEAGKPASVTQNDTKSSRSDSDGADKEEVDVSTQPLEQVESGIYPSAAKLVPILLAIVLSIFLVALDMTIVATAIPRITDEFHSLDQVGWYGSAFFLTVAAFQGTCRC